MLNNPILFVIVFALIGNFDINQDGCNDLVTITTDYVALQHANVFLSDCSGNLVLTDSHVLEGANWTDTLDVLDMNDDGLEDFATGYRSYPGHVRNGLDTFGKAYINTGDGTFTERALKQNDMLKLTVMTSITCPLKCSRS